MRKQIAVLLVTILLSQSASSQSRRVAPTQIQKETASDAARDRSARDMFDEANTYYRTKISEFDQKKLPYSDALDKRTRLEQKQLAAKYAAIVEARRELGPEDMYYLGRLHFLAENLDAARDAMLKYLVAAERVPEWTQAARSVIIVVASRHKDFDQAELQLSDYLKGTPTKASELARMESELGKAYMRSGDFDRAASHASNAYSAIKTVASDPAARARSIDDLLDDGLLLFQAYRASKKRDLADATLEDLRMAGASLNSPTLYYYALDKLINYMIETHRKPLALDTYTLSLERVVKDLPAKEMQTQVIQKLKKREKQYRLLDEPVPELEAVDQWFPGDKVTFAEMRGKVIFLDFWATWCAPCLEAFPSIKELYQDHKSDGLVILGVTRYYGMADGFPADKQNEIAFLKRFRATYDLPYDLVVTRDAATQRAFGATTLPTAVLIDRKGIIRFIDSGTSPTRLEEIRENIVKLLAEK